MRKFNVNINFDYELPDERVDKIKRATVGDIADVLKMEVMLLYRKRLEDKWIKNEDVEVKEY